VAIALKWRGQLPETMFFGNWLQSGSFLVGMELRFDAPALLMAGLVALLSPLAMRFSVAYMHREPGFHRFFAILLLLNGALLLLALSGNAVLAFCGWELSGVASYLLIAYAQHRGVAAFNATRAILTNRVGDLGFLLGILLAQFWVGSLEWGRIFEVTESLPEWQTGVLSCCFLLAALAKSAQLPLTPWLARAMEGPTPSSAIFYGALLVHAGIFLVLRLQPVFSLSPTAMQFMVVLGLLTALYGYFIGLTQTDQKSALIFATTAQTGLMFLEAGMGLWALAWWHLLAHGVFRFLQFLSAPSCVHLPGGPKMRALPHWLARHSWPYLLSLQRFWLEPFTDRLVLQPLQRIALDLARFDNQVLEPLFGLPIQHPTAQPWQRPGMHKAGMVDPEVIRVSGFPGALVSLLAQWSHWFEHHLVLEGVGQNLMLSGRRMAVRLNHVEDLLNQPRYLVVLILITLLAVF
jgi:NADH:ubiquinone oxidoreductase subunit 5 (subunit L)/multisubunit Na+/H+ antiporter MnhA subunit